MALTSAGLCLDDPVLCALMANDAVAVLTGKNAQEIPMPR